MNVQVMFPRRFQAKTDRFYCRAKKLRDGSPPKFDSLPCSYEIHHRSLYVMPRLTYALVQIWRREVLLSSLRLNPALGGLSPHYHVRAIALAL